MMIEKILKSAIFILLVLIFIAMTLMYACEYNRDNKEEIDTWSYRLNSEYINRYISTGKKASDLSDNDVVEIIGEISMLSLVEIGEQVNSLCDYTEDRIQEYVRYDATKDANIPKNIAYILKNYDSMAASMRNDAIFTYLYYRNSHSTYGVPEDLYKKASDFWEEKDVDKIAKRWYWKGDSGEESFVHKVSSEMYASLGKDFDDRVKKQLGWDNGFAQEGDCSFMP